MENFPDSGQSWPVEARNSIFHLVESGNTMSYVYLYPCSLNHHSISSPRLYSSEPGATVFTVLKVLLMLPT